MIEIPLGAGRHKAPRPAQHRPDDMDIKGVVLLDQAGRLKRLPQSKQRLWASTWRSSDSPSWAPPDVLGISWRDRVLLQFKPFRRDTLECMLGFSLLCLQHGISLFFRIDALGKYFPRCNGALSCLR